MWRIVALNPLAAKTAITASASAPEKESPAVKLFSAAIAIIIIGLGVFVFVSMIIWLWLFFFVAVAKYDYVTTSSILFCTFLIPTYLTAALVLLNSPRISTLAGVLTWIVFFPLFISASFGIYERIWPPELSDQLNILKMVRSIPTFFFDGLPQILPLTKSTITYLDEHPTMLAIMSGMVSVAAAYVARFWKVKRT